MEQFCVRYPYTNGGEAIRVERVVVVEVAARVLIPRIVRIATIRRAEVHILRSACVPIINLSMIAFIIRFFPRAEEISNINRLLSPVFDSLGFQMKDLLRQLH